MERWRTIEGFPKYIISTEGRIYNEERGAVLKLSRNREGFSVVGLERGGLRYTRSVSKLVADCWVPNPRYPIFETVVHLDGDRENCYVENLDWRPRWFSIAHHRQFLKPPLIYESGLELIQTREVYTNIRYFSVKYGILESDIVMNMKTLGGRHVFPHKFDFRAL